MNEFEIYGNSVSRLGAVAYADGTSSAPLYQKTFFPLLEQNIVDCPFVLPARHAVKTKEIKVGIILLK